MYTCKNAAITANELNMVIQFLLFGLAVDGKNPMMLTNVEMCIRDRGGAVLSLFSHARTAHSYSSGQPVLR